MLFCMAAGIKPAAFCVHAAESLSRGVTLCQLLAYLRLIDLARSHDIRFVEARGLDIRKGVRFYKDGSEWIAV